MSAVRWTVQTLQLELPTATGVEWDEPQLAALPQLRAPRTSIHSRHGSSNANNEVLRCPRGSFIETQTSDISDSLMMNLFDVGNDAENSNTIDGEAHGKIGLAALRKRAAMDRKRMDTDAVQDRRVSVQHQSKALSGALVLLGDMTTQAQQGETPAPQPAPAPAAPLLSPTHRRTSTMVSAARFKQDRKASLKRAACGGTDPTLDVVKIQIQRLQAASVIQTRFREFLRSKAATCIQRRVRGVIVRQPAEACTPLSRAFSVTDKQASHHAVANSSSSSDDEYVDDGVEKAMSDNRRNDTTMGGSDNEVEKHSDRPYSPDQLETAFVGCWEDLHDELAPARLQPKEHADDGDQVSRPGSRPGSRPVSRPASRMENASLKPCSRPVSRVENASKPCAGLMTDLDITHVSTATSPPQKPMRKKRPQAHTEKESICAMRPGRCLRVVRPSSPSQPVVVCTTPPSSRSRSKTGSKSATPFFQNPVPSANAPPSSEAHSTASHHEAASPSLPKSFMITREPVPVSPLSLPVSPIAASAPVSQSPRQPQSTATPTRPTSAPCTPAVVVSADSPESPSAFEVVDSRKRRPPTASLTWSSPQVSNTLKRAADRSIAMQSRIRLRPEMLGPRHVVAAGTVCAMRKAAAETRAPLETRPQHNPGFRPSTAPARAEPPEIGPPLVGGQLVRRKGGWVVGGCSP